MDFNFIRLSGNEARNFGKDLARLRVQVFREYPYLYDGTLAYEEKYLETYFKAKHAFILLVKYSDKIVGATTGIWAHEEESSFKSPLEKHGLSPDSTFYFGESVLEPEYRGKGLGKVFFQEREKFARSLGFIKALTFAAVVREENHPLKPKNYKPLDEFWISQGFHKEPGLTTCYSWLDRNETEPSEKLMQFWVKRL